MIRKVSQELIVPIPTSGASSAADEPLATDGALAIHYAGGLYGGLIRPDGQGWHYDLLRGDDLFTAGWAPDENSAKQIVQTLAPLYVTN